MDERIRLTDAWQTGHATPEQIRAYQLGQSGRIRVVSAYQTGQGNTPEERKEIVDAHQTGKEELPRP